VKLAQRIGYQNVADFSNQLGFASPVRAYPSTTLGTLEVSLLELVQAYVPFCRDGQLVPLKAIRSILSDGVPEVIEPAMPRKVLDPAVAFLITSALQSAVEEGTAREVRARGFLLPAAGKTGTTDDSWFVGYTPELLAAVWVGYDNGDSLQLSGSQAALPIWTNFMKKARTLGLLSGKAFVPPETVVTVTVDPRTGLLATPSCQPVATEYFVRGSEPTHFCGGSRIHRDVARLPSQPAGVHKRRGFWSWLKEIF
jgi:penicillin-binding protein 1B